MDAPTATAERPPREQVHQTTGLARRERKLGLLFATPSILVVLGMFVVPLLLALWMSANDWPLIGTPHPNFPQNYVDAGTNKLFIGSIWFTVKYTVIITIILTVLPLAMALLVQNSRPGVGFFRTVFLLPSAIGLSAASLLFVGLYNNNFGPLDDILRALGIIHGDANFLGTPGNALASVIVTITWKVAGFNMIILLTGLQAIPMDVYEAARTDGASWWNTLWYITLPMLRSTILMVLVVTVTGSLLAFDAFYVMTGGGPSGSTVTMVIAMFREAFTLFNLGSASAIAVILMVGLIIINALQLYFFRDKDAK